MVPEGLWVFSWNWTRELFRQMNTAPLITIYKVKWVCVFSSYLHEVVSRKSAIVNHARLMKDIFTWPFVVIGDTQKEVNKSWLSVTEIHHLRRDKEKEHSLADLSSHPLANWLLIVYRDCWWCSPVPIKPSVEQNRGPLGLFIVTRVHFGRGSNIQHDKQQ